MKKELLIIIILFLIVGCREASDIITYDQPIETEPTKQVKPVLKVESVNLFGIATEKTKFSKFYKLDKIDAELKVSEYELPLKTSEIKNFNDFNNKINLDKGDELLLNNGFAIVKNPFNSKEEDITQPYKTLKDKEVPIFITTDSLLHLYHIQFDETLRQIEEREFYDKIWNISITLLEEFEKDYENSEGDAQEAIKKNIAYLSVALELLEPKEDQYCKYNKNDDLSGLYKQNKEEYYRAYDCIRNQEAMFTKDESQKYQFEIPELVKEDVEKELGLIKEHKGFSISPLFKYYEDYSQYVSRGHYTRSEKLKNYFQGMMWYGRMAFLLKGGEPNGPNAPNLISEEEAKIQSISAILISSKFAKFKELKDNWDRIYSVTAFYVGLSDDLGPYEYLEALNKIFGSNFDVKDVTPENIIKIKGELAQLNSPEIYGGTGECEKEIGPGEEFKPEHVDECLDKSKGFRMMGQRFIPDSYMFSNLVFPTADKFQGDNPPFTACYIEDYGFVRCFPRGLDVMALLGSKQAKKILADSEDDSYKGYETEFNNLSSEFDAFTVEDWNKNLYWSWLYSLKSLLKNYGKGYPTFMQTDAWHQKQLHSSLASWAELRHDTILYAKQSYTMTGSVTSVRPYIPPPPEKPVVGYIEPVPEFYNRLLALSKMTKEGLEDMGVLDDSSKSRLDSLIIILQRLRDLSIKELENKELEKADYEFIKNFGDELNAVINEVEDKAKKTPIVADVHTDQNTKQVLEEGIGYVDLIVVAYKVPDGRILIGAGPVMTYYEFKHPMEDRLTDEKWKSLLEKGENPKQPDWTKTFISS